MLVSMNKIGLIGFGGGNALIPVIQQEVVEEKGFITGEEYEKDIVAAALTPGALPVEIAVGVGKAVSGKKGMILAAIAMAFPGALMTVLLMAGMDGLNPKVLTQIQYASIGITAFIMCLLTEYIHNAFQDCVVSAGAKTGSAQVGTDIANGVFVAYAPYENPEIAVAIVIEKGGSGAALATTAVEIINSWFSRSQDGSAAVGENTLLK